MRRIVKTYFNYLVSNKTSSIISIIGLSLSIAVVIVLTFFIIQEISYDKAFPNVDNIYKVVTTKNESYVEEDAKEILINKFPQIETACRYYNFKTNLLFNQDFFRGQLVTTDEGFFDVFSVNFVQGSKETAFSKIDGIVLTESLAKEIFNDKYPIGETIKTTGGKLFQVTGVVKDLPKNSSIVADCFIHYTSKIHMSGINNVSTIKLFIVLYPQTSLVEFEKKMSDVLVESSKILNNNPIDFGETIEWKLSPLKTSYFNIQIQNDHLQHANIRLIKIISFITIIILILSIINYVNLNTADILSRIKEIGIRKTNGASKLNILMQFLFESLITCFLATVLALFLTQLIAPIFSQILGKQFTFISFNVLNSTIIILSIISLGILAGLVPASIASNYSPINLFRPKEGSLFKSSVLRNVLNTFQFTISIIMIISAIIILKQIQFSQKRDIGFDADYLIRIEYPGTYDKLSFVKHQLLNSPNILSVSFSDGSPMSIKSHYGSGDPIRNIKSISADDGFIETFRLKLLHGRNIRYPSDIKECLITENAFNEAGWENLDNKIFQNHKVVGVVNSFDNEDLHQLASNVIIENSANHFSSVNVRINPNNVSETLKYIKQIWDNLFAEFGFRYSFYDEWVEKSLLNEKNHARIAIVFGLFSIMLSCLGLFGLANYSLKQRIKEIGIRKCNGATVSEILRLINMDFLKWVIIAFLIACPIAVYIMRKWLDNFAYKTTLDWWIFITSGLIVVTIAFLTISWKSYNSAKTNPVDALRSE
jgi:putative ABC transport system permease protein